MLLQHGEQPLEERLQLWLGVATRVLDHLDRLAVAVHHHLREAAVEILAAHLLQLVHLVLHHLLLLEVARIALHCLEVEVRLRGQRLHVLITLGVIAHQSGAVVLHVSGGALLLRELAGLDLLLVDVVQLPQDLVVGQLLAVLHRAAIHRLGPTTND